MRIVDADRLLEILEGEEKLHSDIPTRADGIRDAIMDVISAQTVDAVPVVHGRWKHKKDLKQFFCDQCGEPSLTEDDVYFYGMEFPNFCPNCGADMRKDGEAHGTK